MRVHRPDACRLWSDSPLTYDHRECRRAQAGQARYIGKKVGDEVTLPGVSAKVIIDRIYTIDLVKVQQFAAEKRSTQTADTTPPV